MNDDETTRQKPHMPVNNSRSEAKIARLKALNKDRARRQQALDLHAEYQPVLHWLVCKYLPLAVPGSAQYEEAIAELNCHLWQLALDFDSSRHVKPITFFTVALERHIWCHKAKQGRQGFVRIGKARWSELQPASFGFTPRGSDCSLGKSLAAKTSEPPLEAREVHEMLAKLSQRDQEVLRLRFFEGLSLQQLAKRLDRSTERARQLTQAALANLAELYGVNDER